MRWNTVLHYTRCSLTFIHSFGAGKVFIDFSVRARDMFSLVSTNSLIAIYDFVFLQYKILSPRVIATIDNLFGGSIQMLQPRQGNVMRKFKKCATKLIKRLCIKLQFDKMFTLDELPIEHLFVPLSARFKFLPGSKRRPQTLNHLQSCLEFRLAWGSPKLFPPGDTLGRRREDLRAIHSEVFVYIPVCDGN